MLPCSYHNITHCSRISLQARSTYPRQATVTLIHSLFFCLQQRKYDPNFQSSFSPLNFSSTSYINTTQQDTALKKKKKKVGGKQVWLQSLEPVGQVGLQIDHMLPHTQITHRTHTHTLPTKTCQTGFPPYIAIERKKTIRRFEMLSVPPTVSASHVNCHSDCTLTISTFH